MTDIDKELDYLRFKYAANEAMKGSTEAALNETLKAISGALSLLDGKTPHDSRKGALQCLRAAIAWLERYERECSAKALDSKP
jgi:hypothetical protein